jgi:hypothetical protein
LHHTVIATASIFFVVRALDEMHNAVAPHQIAGLA